MLRPGVLWCLMGMALLLNACIGPKSEGAKFYQIFHERGSWAGTSEELEKYPLEQQYEIFVYGMQKVHPPDSELANAIAKHGKPAMDYVLSMVAASGKDMDYVDSMEVFEAMVRGGALLGLRRHRSHGANRSEREQDHTRGLAEALPTRPAAAEGALCQEVVTMRASVQRSR